jgi:hypothetical protein
MPYLPPAALCAVATALALAGCQGKTPDAQAETAIDPAIAAAVAQTRAGPAFAITPVADASGPAAPKSTLGEPTTTKGFNHTFNIVPAASAPAAAPAPAPAPAGGDATDTAGEG